MDAPRSRSSETHSFSFRRIPTDAAWKSHLSRKRHSRLEYSPDENFSRNEEDNSNSAGWIESLKARASELDEQEERRISRWKNATCSSKVAVILPDWVRRLDVDYPLAVCGSSRGYLYVTHLETGEVLATNLKPENEQESDNSEDELSTPENLEQTLRLLYGSFDGGGTLAVAFSGSRICSADRSGGVQLWGYDLDSKQLVSQGSMGALEGVLVVSLQLDDEFLWVGTADGQLQGYPLDDDLPLALHKSPECSWKLSSALVSMHVDSELGCAVASTAFGKVELVSLEDEASGQPFASFTPPFDSMERKSSNAFVQACTFVAHSEPKNRKNSQIQQYSVVCGGNNGSLFQQRLKLDEFGNVDTKNPFYKSLKAYESRHLASVRSLSSPRPGIVVSGGQDSSLRVWDVDEMTFLYQFVGYKVWLNSIWSDGARIVSDGADNTIVMHDFDKEDSSDSSDI